MSLEETNVIYKPSLESNMSHFVVQSEFEDISLNPFCLLDFVPKCLLVGKLSHYGPRNELSG